MIYLWYHIWYHIFYDIIHDIICFYTNIIYNIINDIIQKPYHIDPFLALLWSKKIWYHIWYHTSMVISYMISYFFFNIIVIYPFLALSSCHIKYDIIYISYRICSDIRITWYSTWFRLWWPSDISIPHSHAISQILWCYSLYHGTCAAGWHGLGAPGAKHSTSESSGLTIANLNVLGTGVELNGDGLDPAHGLVAVVAAKFQV